MFYLPGLRCSGVKVFIRFCGVWGGLRLGFQGLEAPGREGWFYKL